MLTTLTITMATLKIERNARIKFYVLINRITNAKISEIATPFLADSTNSPSVAIQHQNWFAF